MKHSIAQQRLDQHAGKNPAFAERLRAVRATYGAAWDPGSVLARRFRAVRYAESFLEYMREIEGGLLPESYFAEIRESLADHVDGVFAGLTITRAVELTKPRRGPSGAAGLVARWSVAVGAFGETDAATAAKRFRQAVRDVSPARRKRTRAR